MAAPDKYAELCPYDGPAHDFKPLTLSNGSLLIGGELMTAICGKCGLYR